MHLKQLKDAALSEACRTRCCGILSEKAAILTDDVDSSTRRSLSAGICRRTWVLSGVVASDALDLQRAGSSRLRHGVVCRCLCDDIVVATPDDGRHRNTGHMTLQHHRRSFWSINGAQRMDKLGCDDTMLSFCKSITTHRDRLDTVYLGGWSIVTATHDVLVSTVISDREHEPIDELCQWTLLSAMFYNVSLRDKVKS